MDKNAQCFISASVKEREFSSLIALFLCDEHLKEYVLQSSLQEEYIYAPRWPAAFFLKSQGSLLVCFWPGESSVLTFEKYNYIFWLDGPQIETILPCCSTE